VQEFTINYILNYFAIGSPLSRAHNPVNLGRWCATLVHHGPGGGTTTRLTGGCAPQWLQPRNLTAKALKRRGERGGPHHGVGQQRGAQDLADDDDERRWRNKLDGREIRVRIE
jgi:hypothetical protein